MGIKCGLWFAIMVGSSVLSGELTKGMKFSAIDARLDLICNMLHATARTYMHPADGTSALQTNDGNTGQTQAEQIPLTPSACFVWSKALLPKNIPPIFYT